MISMRVHALRPYVAALRLLLVLTAVLGVIYPLSILLISQVPGARAHADGSLVTVHGKVVGSRLVGQSFTDANGRPLPAYFQSRPSAAGAGYDPTATSASNLGPESIVDTLPNPAVPGDTGKQSLLTQVCARSLAIGRFDGVDGSRPFCTPDGVGAVLGVFYAGPGYHGAVVRVVALDQACPAQPFQPSYRGVSVECAQPGADYSHAQVVPIRGAASSTPAVPPDAVTASGSGIDPDISVAYARIQEARIAQARHVQVAQIAALVRREERGRGLGFIGAPTVNVLELNVALDANYPVP